MFLENDPSFYNTFFENIMKCIKYNKLGNMNLIIATDFQMQFIFKFNRCIEKINTLKTTVNLIISVERLYSLNIVQTHLPIYNLEIK